VRGQPEQPAGQTQAFPRGRDLTVNHEGRATVGDDEPAGEGLNARLAVVIRRPDGLAQVGLQLVAIGRRHPGERFVFLFDGGVGECQRVCEQTRLGENAKDRRRFDRKLG
jgi:hypothetical protein